MVKIRQKLVSEAQARKVTNGTGNSKRKICIHETDNTRATANADAHSRLQFNGNSRQASWHWQVDDKEAVQSFTHSWKCWAAGNSKGNNEAIHVEICVNSDGDYIKAAENAAKLVAKIMEDENISIQNVVQHNFYSGKNCPRVMRTGSKVSWSQFLKMVQESEELTVSQYKELQSQINHLNSTIKTLQAQVNNKANTSVDGPVSDWAREFYDWGVRMGITDGSNPQGALTRQQGLTMLYRLHDMTMKEIEKLKNLK